MVHEISFPGLGIGPFTIDSVAFTLFGREIQWYGILICIGMILAYLYASTRAKFEGIKTDDLLDLGFFVILFGIIGARLYYVVFAPTSYIATGGTFWENVWDTIVNVVSIWEGGLAIFGGILAGFLTALVVARIKKIHFPVLLDILAPSVMIGQIIGRWGNFMNGEAYGRETALPWRMEIRDVYANGSYGPTVVAHPTFLYESLWNLIGFLLIAIFYKKKKFNGQIFYFYMIWYGLGRAVIEGLRTDSLYIANLRVSQVLAALVCVAGIVLMTVNFMRYKNRKKCADGVVGEAAPKPDAETADMLPAQERAGEDFEDDIKTDAKQGGTKDGSEDH